MKKLSIKHVLIIFAFMLFLLFLNSKNTYASSLYLDNLNFNVNINSDGSMDVKETWDISISNTNTLFKTFKIDSSKYSDITNVSVIQNTKSGVKNLTRINEEMYHVTDNCFYALKNSDGLFEIAWNVGLDNSSDNRTYVISYKVNNAIGKYNDCDELYWQFIGESFEVDAKKITGTINLPKSVDNIKDLRIWGHTKYLNGTVSIINNKSTNFEIDNFESGTYVEIRMAMPEGTISSSSRTYNKDILGNILSEEAKWADEANKRRDDKIAQEKMIKLGLIIFAIVVSILLLFLAIKFYKKLKEFQKIQFKPEVDYKYFRDLPNKDTSPAESIFLTSSFYESFPLFGNIFSATILDLTLKGYLTIEVLNNDPKKKENIVINFTNKVISNLPSDEELILNFLKKAQKDEVLTLKEFEKYVSKNSTKVISLQSDLSSKVKSNQIIKGNFNTENYKTMNTYSLLFILFLVFSFFTFIIPGLNILMIINTVLTYKISKAINVLSQDALNESVKWKGLKKYMEDFSLLKEKEVPDLVLWEHFLVYATSFGIANKVLKQLSIVYPNFEESTVFTTGSYMYLMTNTNFANSFSSGITSAINTTYSSGGGAGRWILWRWRRRRPEVAGGGGR